MSWWRPVLHVASKEYVLGLGFTAVPVTVSTGFWFGILGLMLAASDNSDLFVTLSQDLSCVAQDLTLRPLPTSRTAGSENAPHHS